MNHNFIRIVICLSALLKLSDSTILYGSLAEAKRSPQSIILNRVFEETALSPRGVFIRRAPFPFRDFVKNRFAVFETPSGMRLLLTLRSVDDNLKSYTRYMIDVLDPEEKTSAGYLDFALLPLRLPGQDRRVAVLNEAYRFMPFPLNIVERLHQEGINVSNPTRLRPLFYEKIGLFMAPPYRNKGSKEVWNLDCLLMALASEIADELHQAENLQISSIGSKYAYYQEKFGAKPAGYMGVQVLPLGKNKPPYAHITLGIKDGIVSEFLVESGPDASIIPLDWTSRLPQSAA